MLLLLATYLPITASNDIAGDKGSKKFVLWIAGLIVPLSLSMEGAGAVIQD